MLNKVYDTMYRLTTVPNGTAAEKERGESATSTRERTILVVPGS
jgi:hypothetical protein